MLLLSLPVDAAAGTAAGQVMMGGHLGITPGARRPLALGVELGLGLSGHGAPIDAEALIRGELRAGRVAQLGLGLRTVLGTHDAPGLGGYSRQAGLGLLTGVALRGDGRSGWLLGGSAIAGAPVGEARVSVDAVAPFAGRAPRVTGPRWPRGVEEGPNPLAYRLRGGDGPRSTRFVETTVSLSAHAYAFPAWGILAGRPCRDGAGGSSLAPVWVAGATTPAAEAWIERGREEAASVGVFVQLARDLAALGAPRALVHRALRAADEEVAHALLAYAMAERTAPGLRVLPGGWPSPPALAGTRTERLARLALESVLDGVGAEAEAAKRSLDLRDAATDPVEAAVEDRIAREEAGHAALAEVLVCWAVAEGGRAVREALRAA